MFLGADTDELQEAGQKCQEGAETTDDVIMFLRALVIALRAASFFTGGASAAYAQYLESTVIPWLQRVSAALKLFAQVLLSQADAQNRVSAGETVDFGTLPTYTRQALPTTSTCDYPPVVAPNAGVTAPVCPPPSATPGTGVPDAGTGTGVTVPAGDATAPAAPMPAPSHGSSGIGTSGVGTVGVGTAGIGGGTGAGTGTASSGSPATGIGTSAPVGGSTGTGPGGGQATGSGGESTPQLGGGLPGSTGTSGDHAAAGAGESGDPGSRAFGTTTGVDALPTSETAPIDVSESGAGGFGTAAAIGTGAAALGLGGAAMARRGKQGDAELEALVAGNGRGSRGEEVRDLQERLTAAGYDTRGVDGQWGGNTQAAYEAWRADHPLEVRTGTGFTSPDGFDYHRIRGVEGNPNVTPEFLREMEGVAQRVGARPEDLMAVMALESNRTFSPSVQNADTQATGLIQFMPRTARGLDTSIEELAGMTATEQLPYVEAFLMERRGHIGNLESLYTSILHGSPREDPSTVLWSTGTEAYHDNHGLDRNRDGRITAGEAADSVRTFIKN